MLSSVGQRPSPESLKRLENEFSLKDELDPSWAAQPLGLATHWGRTVLVLKDPGGAALESAFGSRVAASSVAGARESCGPGSDGLDLAFGLRVAINLAAAIGALHRQGIIHKDVKPSSVLVDLTDGAVEFLAKPFRDQDLLDAIQHALELDRAARSDRAVVAELRHRYESLTRREREVMALIVSGLLNKQVAAELGSSEVIIKIHRAHVMRKMKAESVVQLVHMAEKIGGHASKQ